MSTEREILGQEGASHNGTEWSFSIRSQLRQWVDTLIDPRHQYERAGRMEHEPDGSVSFHASEAQVAAWQAEAKRTGRGFEQIVRYHLVTGVEVQGPDDLVMTMTFQPRGDE